MVRQAHTYLVGAMSGATLIAIAIAVFVVLVSAQVFNHWPIAALGGDSGDSAAVSKAHQVGGAAGSSAGAPLAAAGAAGKATAAARVRAGGSGSGGDQSGSVAAGDGVLTPEGTQVTSTDRGESAAGGDQSGSATAASPQSPGTAAAPSGTSSSSSGGGSSGGSGATGGSSGTTPSTSAGVTETVNGTVAKVDETALGGTLHETGVTGVTESVVNGVAGPESTVGKVVDETVGVVGGLLGGKR